MSGTLRYGAIELRPLFRAAGASRMLFSARSNERIGRTGERKG